MMNGTSVVFIGCGSKKPEEGEMRGIGEGVARASGLKSGLQSGWKHRNLELLANGKILRGAQRCFMSVKALTCRDK